jgi:hypothetical protein
MWWRCGGKAMAMIVEYRRISAKRWNQITTRSVTPSIIPSRITVRLACVDDLPKYALTGDAEWRVAGQVYDQGAINVAQCAPAPDSVPERPGTEAKKMGRKDTHKRYELLLDEKDDQELIAYLKAMRAQGHSFSDVMRDLLRLAVSGEMPGRGTTTVTSAEPPAWFLEAFIELGERQNTLLERLASAENFTMPDRGLRAPPTRPTTESGGIDMSGPRPDTRRRAPVVDDADFDADAARRKLIESIQSFGKDT